MEWKMMFILIFSGIWCFLGIVFLSVSWIISSVRANKNEVCTSKAMGTVTGFASGRQRSGGLYPVVEYTTARGETLTVRSNIGMNPPKYKAGDIVHIKYDPNKPESFYIDGDDTANTVKKIFFFVGLGLIAVGLTVGILVFIFA